ncbi:hypothetical protein ACLHDF_25300 [Priestia aryabhattai]|uniref:hypothetical protein n=1 Tax=Priestia megaterium TaxID=1404 RepID=UPI0039B893A4
MFKLPLEFDKNEWFVTLTMIFLIIIFSIVPKLMPRGMTLSILLYFSVLGLTADILIGVDYPFNFYKIMDSSKLEVFDVLIYGVNYTLYGYFFSYFIYKWETRRANFLLVILWIGLSTLIEWVSEKFNVFTYTNGWHIGLSAISYIFVYTLSVIIIRFFIRLWKYTDPT